MAQFVMAGLVPAIPVFLTKVGEDAVARDKPGHDEPTCALRDKSSGNRQSCDCVGMDACAVNDWESRSFFIEGPKHDCPGPTFIEKLLTDGVENLSLRLCHNAGRRHVSVRLMYVVQVLSVRRDIRRR